MRYLACLALLAAVTVTVASADPIPVPNRGLKTYKGAWFDIKYPLGFKALPRQKSASGPGWDAVSFISPDNRVEFYIYSPQWSGEADWLQVRPGEKETSRSTEKLGDKVITYVTYKAPTFTRSYAEYRQPDYNTRWIFGYKYLDSASYHAYRDLYLKFKQSLKQYAD